MRFLRFVSPTAALLACSSPAPTDSRVQLTTAPPTLSVAASTRVVRPDGRAALEVSATLRNATAAHIRVAVGAACPLGGRLFADPTGEVAGVADASMACPAAAPSQDLAPGDSTTLAHVVPADSVAALGPGVYGVNAVVTTSTAVTGVWAGAVTLPLPSAP